MKKRIGPVRSMAMSPKCLLYDEPIIGLDLITADSISDPIVQLKKRA